MVLMLNGKTAQAGVTDVVVHLGLSFSRATFGVDCSPGTYVIYVWVYLVVKT
jgi:hypothetical protein